MDTNMFLNFNDVAVPTANYIEPGQYRTKVSKVELTDVANKQGGSKKVLKVTFTTKDDKSYTENFYLQGETDQKTKSALGRLQYFYNAVFGKTISESFKSFDEIKDYFEAKFMGKSKPDVLLIVGGEKQENGTVYARLGFTRFIYEGNEKDFVEEVFEKDSAKYKEVVSVKKSTAAGIGMASTSAPALNATTGAAVSAPWE
jgi:hypothetical protein